MEQGSTSISSSGTLSIVDRNILELVQSQYADLYETCSELLRHLGKEWQAQSSYYALLESLTRKRGSHLASWWPSLSATLMGPDIRDELERLKACKSNLKNAMVRFDKHWKSLHQAWVESELKLRMARERHASNLMLFLKSILGKHGGEASRGCSGPWSSQQSLLCSHDVYLDSASQSKAFLLASARDMLDLIYPQSKETLRRSLTSVYEKKVARLEREKEFHQDLLANVRQDEQRGTSALEASLAQIFTDPVKPFSASFQPVMHGSSEAHDDEEPGYRVADALSLPFDGDFEPGADFAGSSLEAKRGATPFSFYSAAGLPDDALLNELERPFPDTHPSNPIPSSSLSSLLEDYRQKIQPTESVSAMAYLDLAWQQCLHSLLTQLQCSTAPLSPTDFSCSSTYEQLERVLRGIYRLESRLSSLETPFSTSYHFHVLRIGVLSKMKTRMMFQYWKKAVVILSSDSHLNVYYCQSSELEQLGDGSSLTRHEKLLDVLWRDRQSLEPDESYDLGRGGGVQVKALPLDLAFELHYPDVVFEPHSSSEKCVQGLVVAMGGGSSGGSSADKHPLKWKSEHIDDLVDWVVALQGRLHVHANPSKELERCVGRDGLAAADEAGLSSVSADMETVSKTVETEGSAWRMTSIPLGEDAHDPWQS